MHPIEVCFPRSATFFDINKNAFFTHCAVCKSGQPVQFNVSRCAAHAEAHENSGDLEKLLTPETYHAHQKVTQLERHRRDSRKSGR